MNEDQWLTCTSPEALLQHLTDRASPRKLRLFAIGCCRRIWHLFKDDRYKHAVEVAQRFADGQASPVELAAAGHVMAGEARLSLSPITGRGEQAGHAIAGTAWAATRESAWVGAWDAGWDARISVRDEVKRNRPDELGNTSYELERAWQAELIHDIFGNPFRRITIDPAWLHASDSAVTQMARVIYAEDRFGDLPILADALEEAGCTNDQLLDHCRERRAHYRGCWVVDAILGYR